MTAPNSPLETAENAILDAAAAGEAPAAVQVA